MDLKTTPFGAYLAGLTPSPVIATQQVAALFTPSTIIRSEVLCDMLTATGQQASNPLTHYFGVYGVVETRGSHYGSFITLLNKDRTGSFSRWVTTLGGQLMVREHSTHTPYESIRDVGSAVTNALVYRVRNGDEQRLVEFDITLFTFSIPKAAHLSQQQTTTTRAPIPRSTAVPPDPRQWHCVDTDD